MCFAGRDLHIFVHENLRCGYEAILVCTVSIKSLLHSPKCSAFCERVGWRPVLETLRCMRSHAQQFNSCLAWRCQRFLWMAQSNTYTHTHIYIYICVYIYNTYCIYLRIIMIIRVSLRWDTQNAENPQISLKQTHTYLPACLPTSPT